MFGLSVKNARDNYGETFNWKHIFFSAQSSSGASLTRLLRTQKFQRDAKAVCSSFLSECAEEALLGVAQHIHVAQHTHVAQNTHAPVGCVDSQAQP